MNVGKKYINSLKELESSGYSWKSTPTNFMKAPMTEIGEKFMANNGGKYAVTWAANTASGNRYKVRKNTSPTRDAAWKYEQTINPHKPQAVYYM